MKKSCITTAHGIEELSPRFTRKLGSIHAMTPDAREAYILLAGLSAQGSNQG